MCPDDSIKNSHAFIMFFYFHIASVPVTFSYCCYITIRNDEAGLAVIESRDWHYKHTVPPLCTHTKCIFGR